MPDKPTVPWRFPSADTGIGIAPEDQPRIFEEFRQVGNDSARKVEGTGLGLTLAKKFVELHGGKIWVESEVGQGVDLYLYPTHPLILDLRFWILDCRNWKTHVSRKARQGRQGSED